MSFKTCEYGVYNPRTRNVDPCGKKCEGDTDFCGSHNRLMRKQETDSSRESEKRAHKIAQQKAKNSLPRKTISKNPKDWSNTFLCSDGTRLLQWQIAARRNYEYNKKYPEKNGGCELCKKGGTVYSHAHLIPQARCKQIGKTELIWHHENFYRAHFECNAMLENPKGDEWKNFPDIEIYLAFIKEHDPILFAKFESRLATNPTI